MSESNGTGVIRIGRKGRRKFAFGEDGEPFEVDVVVAFQEWICVDNQFRENYEDRMIPPQDMASYHQAAVEFVWNLSKNTFTDSGGQCAITPAEALDFIARLRECYDEVADFFQPRSREKPDSPGSSGAELRFSVEGS